jgi:hypothetical protein
MRTLEVTSVDIRMSKHGAPDPSLSSLSSLSSSSSESDSMFFLEADARGFLVTLRGAWTAFFGCGMTGFFVACCLGAKKQDIGARVCEKGVHTNVLALLGLCWGFFVLLGVSTLGLASFGARVGRSKLYGVGEGA